MDTIDSITHTTDSITHTTDSITRTTDSITGIQPILLHYIKNEK